ncbi:MAG: arylesterase [Pseudomonadota bacterium]
MGSWGYGAITRARNLAAVIVFCAGGPAVAEVTIAALGDSLTQGYGLVPEEGLVPQLSRWLADNGAEVTLINAGVSGDTTAGGAARIGWTLTDEVDALIVALGGNDVLRGVAPEEARANLDTILAESASRGLPVLLIGITAPGNYGPDYKASFEAIYPELADEYGTLLITDMLAPIAAQGTGTALAEYMQGDAIHPNAKGVALIVDTIGPQVLTLIDQID